MSLSVYRHGAAVARAQRAAHACPRAKARRSGIGPAIAAIAGGAAILIAARAPAAIATFDSGVEGWSAGVGAAAWESQDGAPGGFLRLQSPGAGVSAIASAASYFLGDQSHMFAGAIEFDVRIVQGPYEAEIAPGVAVGLSVTIGNSALKGVGSVSHTIQDAVRIDGPWVRVSVSLAGADWGVTDEQLSAVLAGVTDLRIALDAQGSNMPGAFGLDNFTIIPTPGSALLLAMSGLALVARRRH